MNLEAEKLIKKARRSLRAAKNLLEDGDHDFAVSRAYYAMFYAAEALLLSKGLSYSKHSGVISGFWEHFIKDGSFPKELHKNFHAAFEERNVGDYGFDVSFPKEEAENILDQAVKFVNTSENYLKS